LQIGKTKKHLNEVSRIEGIRKEKEIGTIIE